MSESEQVCIDIFNDFELSELDSVAESIRHAWHIGEELNNQ
jgi:hypothetical protein